MDYWERGFHARGAYPTLYTSRMRTVRVKQEIVRNIEERNVGTKGKSSKQDLANAKNLTIELPEEPNLPIELPEEPNLTLKLPEEPNLTLELPEEPNLTCNLHESR